MNFIIRSNNPDKRVVLNNKRVVLGNKRATNG